MQYAKLFMNQFGKEILPKYSNDNEIINFKNTIDLKNISFKYKSSENFIIENINLKIQKGNCIGFVGKSGAGKSTLIDLLIGLLPASSGTISVDGKSLIHHRGHGKTKLDMSHKVFF